VENDSRTGGNFSYKMEAKDGSIDFNYSGVYDKIVIFKQIDYTIDKLKHNFYNEIK